jgi:2-succinyl-5-enolpyruvyl-6-hydroxy-3-cyclohexene-1-carboxylate synthase
LDGIDHQRALKLIKQLDRRSFGFLAIGRFDHA